MAKSDAALRGREAFERREWGEAYAQFAAADRASRLDLADLERLATAAYLVGEDAAAKSGWTRLHHELIDSGKPEHAARCGFWLSLNHLLGGEVAQCTGWFARSERLLGNRGECAERGYGLVVAGLLAMGKGDGDSAARDFARAAGLADRFGDPDLLSLGLLGQGQVLLGSRQVASGVACLDEAMVAVTTGEVSPVFAGIIYCAVILACQSIFDFGRAREWTRQLDDWCAAQPELVPYRGRCLVHRSEILQLEGDWARAAGEARRAREHLSEQSGAVVGHACYQQGEIHRLRGEFDEAEAMFREAGRHGREPQPGVSLLRLAEGKAGAAAAAIRSAVGADRPGAGRRRPGLLGPFVEIMLASGDVEAARAGADELTAVSAEIGGPFLQAMASGATGAVLIAEGETEAALDPLRESRAVWQELGVPYEAARIGVLIGQACRLIGDRETADMHLDAAASLFRALDALPDLDRLRRLTAPGPTRPADTLTAREREVLALVAAGRTNREIAGELTISEHTVARHLSNIFDKLGVATRTAAAALAHERKLV